MVQVPELCKMEANEQGFNMIDPQTGIKIMRTVGAQLQDNPTMCDIEDFIVQRHYESLKYRLEYEYSLKSLDKGLELEGCWQ